MHKQRKDVYLPTQTEVQKLIVSHFAGKYPFMEKSLNRLMEVIVDS